MLDKIKDYYRSRGIGFWLSVGMAVVMLFLAISYPINFYWTIYFDANVGLFLTIGLILGVLLAIGGIFVRYLAEWTPAVFCGFTFVAQLFFLKGIWMMIQDAVGGYEFFGLSDTFWIFLIPSILVVLSALVCIFGIKQEKAPNSAK